MVDMSTLTVDSFFLDVMSIMSFLNNASESLLDKYVLAAIKDPKIQIKLLSTYYTIKCNDKKTGKAVLFMSGLINEVTHRSDNLRVKKNVFETKVKDFLHNLIIIREALVSSGIYYADMENMEIKYSDLLGIKRVEPQTKRSHVKGEPFYLPRETSPFIGNNLHLYDEIRDKILYIKDQYPDSYKNIPIKVLDGKYTGRTGVIKYSNGTTVAVIFEGETEDVKINNNRLLAFYFKAGST